MSFSPKKQAAIDALIESRNVTRAAERAGVSTTTLWRWCREPAFKEAIESARADIFNAAIDRLKAATGRAATVLIERMESPDDSVAIRSARAIFDEFAKATDRLAVETKIGELERQMAELKATRRGLR